MSASTPALALRAARANDLAAISAIEQFTFSDPWSASMFRVYLLGDVSQFIVATHDHPDGPILGYALAHVVADESELLNIAVHPDWRGRAVGATLLDALAEQCHACGATCMLLDVRESNTPARTLYERRGFLPVGRRRRYYTAPTEDALLMRAELPFTMTRHHDTQ